MSWRSVKGCGRNRGTDIKSVRLTDHLHTDEMPNDQFKTKTQLRSIKKPWNNIQEEVSDIKMPIWKLIAIASASHLTSRVRRVRFPRVALTFCYLVLDCFSSKRLILRIGNAFVRWNGEENEQKTSRQHMSGNAFFVYIIQNFSFSRHFVLWVKIFRFLERLFVL